MKPSTLFLPVFVCAALSMGKNNYVSDSIEITLRQSASNKAKIIATPESGESLTILDGEGDWLKVRVDETGDKGWVLKRYVMKRAPYKSQLDYVSSKNKDLKESITELKTEIDSLRNEKRTIQRELNSANRSLANVQTKYADLSEGASDFLAMMNEFDSTKTLLETERKNVESLTAMNKELKKKSQFLWFLSGAILVLVSYMLGTSTRKGKKRGYNYR